MKVGRYIMRYVGDQESRGNLALGFVLFAAIGLVAGTTDWSEPAVSERMQECEPLTRQESTDQESWDTLIDAGWEQRTSSTLYPPGCQYHGSAR